MQSTPSSNVVSRLGRIVWEGLSRDTNPVVRLYFPIGSSVQKFPSHFPQTFLAEVQFEDQVNSVTTTTRQLCIST